MIGFELVCFLFVGQAGQQRMVRDGDKIMMYVWNTNSGQWDLLGDVTGSGTDDHAPQGKTLYKGKVKT